MTVSAPLAREIVGRKTLSELLASIMPAYRCFVPVQAHINRVDAVMSPGQRCDGWSGAQIAFALGGVLMWPVVLAPVG